MISLPAIALSEGWSNLFFNYKYFSLQLLKLQLLLKFYDPVNVEDNSAVWFAVEVLEKLIHFANLVSLTIVHTVAPKNEKPVNSPSVPPTLPIIVISSRIRYSSCTVLYGKSFRKAFVASGGENA